MWPGRKTAFQESPPGEPHPLSQVKRTGNGARIARASHLLVPDGVGDPLLDLWNADQGTKIRENRMGSEPEMRWKRGPTGEGGEEGEAGEEVEQLLPRHHALAAGRRHVRFFPAGCCATLPVVCQSVGPVRLWFWLCFPCLFFPSSLILPPLYLNFFNK